jgi:hypothetical protein
VNRRSGDAHGVGRRLACVRSPASRRSMAPSASSLNSPVCCASRACMSATLASSPTGSSWWSRCVAGGWSVVAASFSTALSGDVASTDHASEPFRPSECRLSGAPQCPNQARHGCLSSEPIASSESSRACCCLEAGPPFPGRFGGLVALPLVVDWPVGCFSRRYDRFAGRNMLARDYRRRRLGPWIRACG